MNNIFHICFCLIWWVGFGSLTCVDLQRCSVDPTISFPRAKEKAKVFREVLAGLKSKYQLHWGFFREMQEFFAIPFVLERGILKLLWSSWEPMAMLSLKMKLRWQALIVEDPDSPCLQKVNSYLMWGGPSLYFADQIARLHQEKYKVWTNAMD